MLIRLLRTHLRPYRKVLLWIIALQTVQTVAALTLPTLNANIIDKGIIKGDVGYIRSTGAVMVGFTFIQIIFAVAAIYLGGKVAMSFGATCARRCSIRSPSSPRAKSARSARRR